jgi:hypothetical protein
MAAIPIHVATTRMVNIDNSTGAIVDKNLPTTTINQVAQSSSEIRVDVDSSNSNTSNYPTITDYLKAEAAAGYTLAHMTQNYIVTYQYPAG